MTRMQYSSCLKLALTAGVAATLAACESSGGYRIASVGQVPADAGANGGTGDGSSGGSTSSGGTGSSSSGMSGSSGGGTGSSSGGQGGLGSRVLVSAGNTVIGVSGTTANLAPGLPAAGRITGTVTAVLRRSGQTLVDLGQNRSLILNATGGRLGDLVTVDLGARRVVGTTGSQGLIGAGVLPVTGGLATATVGRGVTPGAGMVNGVTGAAGSLTQGLQAPLPGVAAGGSAGAGVGATIGGVTQPVTAAAGGSVVGGVTALPGSILHR